MDRWITQTDFMQDFHRGLCILKNWKPQPIILSQEVIDVLLKAGHIKP